MLTLQLRESTELELPLHQIPIGTWPAALAKWAPSDWLPAGSVSGDCDSLDNQDNQLLPYNTGKTGKLASYLLEITPRSKAT